MALPILPSGLNMCGRPWPGTVNLCCGGGSKLLKPRGHWPVDDLPGRITGAIGNAAVVDRRLQEISIGARRALALIGQSRQARGALAT